MFESILDRFRGYPWCMQIDWDLLIQWRAITIASVIALLVQVFSFYSAFHALRHVRTSQAAVAWAVGLATLSLLALPLYWVFARHRFEGYREAIREVGVRYQHSATAVQNELVTGKFARTTDQQTALERVADILDTPISSGNHFELLIDGVAFFDAIESAVANARSYIYVSFYIIRDDKIGNRLADAVDRASQSRGQGANPLRRSWLLAVVQRLH